MTMTATQSQVLAQVLDDLDPDADVLTDTAAMLRRTLRALPVGPASAGLDRSLRADLALIADELDLLSAL